jgi:predicted transcriptional regulator
MRMTATKPKPQNVKSEAAKLIKALPRDASWEDLAYQIHVRQKIANGMADLNAGRVHTHEAVKKAFAPSK